MLDWDELSAHYERQLRLERRPLRAALALARVGGADRLLDVATGTGELLKLLAAGGTRPAGVVGIDASPKMLARSAGLPAGWETSVADARAIPVADSHFDVVTCAYLVHLLAAADRERVLAEIARVLAPGGRAVLVTPTLPLPLDSAAIRRASRALSRIARGRWLTVMPLDPREGLEAAGLSVDAVRRVWLGYPSLVVRARAA